MVTWAERGNRGVVRGLQLQGGGRVPSVPAGGHGAYRHGASTRREGARLRVGGKDLTLTASREPEETKDGEKRSL